MMKTKQDNNMINRIGAIYTENDNELSLLIRLGADYNENQIEQLCD